MNNIFLSIVIPVYNEEKRIVKCLEKIEEYFNSKNFSYEVVFVDDGSQDKTVDRINERIRDKRNYRLLKDPINHGKGYSIKKGVLSALGENILFIDADMSTPIDQLQKFLPYIDKFDVIIGSRYLDSGNIKIRQPLIRRIVSRLGNFTMRTILGLPFVDTQCGFKLFHKKPAKEIFSRQTIERWGFDMEILTIAKRLKYTIKEVGVDWLDDPNSTLRAGQAIFNTFRELLKIKLNIIFNRYQ